MASERQGGEAKKQSFIARIYAYLRKCIFHVIRVGPLPKHMAFIMDGNRRYARKKNLEEKDGYRIGFFTLMSILKYCYELGIKHISVYAFSIDNFKRKRDNVEFLMQLMQEKIEGLLQEESIAHEYGLRVTFVGNLNLLSDELRVTAKRAMEATSMNDKVVLQICVAYTATDEIVHAMEECCNGKWGEEGRELGHERKIIELGEIEKHMYMSVVPDPDILVRTSGETRLSNFILWHTRSCLLYSPTVLWPEFGLWHLVWVLLNFQRHYHYLHNKRKWV